MSKSTAADANQMSPDQWVWLLLGFFAKPCRIVMIRSVYVIGRQSSVSGSFGFLSNSPPVGISGYHLCLRRRGLKYELIIREPESFDDQNQEMPSCAFFSQTLTNIRVTEPKLYPNINSSSLRNMSRRKLLLTHRRATQRNNVPRNIIITVLHTGQRRHNASCDGGHGRRIYVYI